MTQEVTVNWDVVKEFVRSVIFEFINEDYFKERVNTLIDIRLNNVLGEKIKISKTAKDKELMESLTKELIEQFVKTDDFYEYMCDILRDKFRSSPKNDGYR